MSYEPNVYAVKMTCRVGNFDLNITWFCSPIQVIALDLQCTVDEEMTCLLPYK